MGNDNKRSGSGLDRRHLLQAGLAAAFAAPLGAFGAAQERPVSISRSFRCAGRPRMAPSSPARRAS